MGQRLGFLAGLVCLACGGSEEAPATTAPAGGAGGSGGAGASGGSGGGAGTGGSSGGGTGGAGATGGGGSGGTGGGMVVGEGAVILYQEADAHVLLGYFGHSPSGPCTGERHGPCNVTRCASPTSYADAGDITVAAGTLRQTVVRQATRQYDSRWPGRLWQPGDAVRIASVGAEVPAFDLTLTAPTPITLVEPASGSTLTVNRTRDLRVRWTGSTTGSVAVGFVQPEPLPMLKIKCTFDATASEGVVPAAALSALAPGGVNFQAFAEDYEARLVQGWDVVFAVRPEPFELDATVE